MHLPSSQNRNAKLLADAEERRRIAANTPNSLYTAASVKRQEALMPYRDYNVDVPKSDEGELRIHIKFNRKQGLFIHGFKEDSLAEKQGIVRVADELLEIDGERVLDMQTLVSILRSHDAEYVSMKLRRHLPCI